MTVLETVSCAVCGGTERVPARLRTPKDPHALALGLPGGRSSWVVCSTCGLVYQCPRPSSESVERLYLGGDYHSTRGGVPEHYVQYSLRRSLKAIDWVLGLPPLAGRVGRALDIGCGVGGALVELRRRGWEVVGIEPDPELAETGRRRFGLDIVSGVLDEHALEGEHFDLAYSCHVWEHLADPGATTGAAHRLLQGREGVLAIVVPTFRSSRTLAWSCFTAPHTYMFTDVSLRNVTEAAGFEHVASTYTSAADSELWFAARAGRGARPAAVVPEPVERVQRDLVTVPLRLPLGIGARAATHLSTLRRDPADFAARLSRWVRYQGGRVARSIKPGG